MSKIYEALQRAELDRAAALGDQKERAAQGPGTAVEAWPEAAPGVRESMAAAAAVREQEARTPVVTLPIAAAIAVREAADEAGRQTGGEAGREMVHEKGPLAETVWQSTVWTPSFKQLPALERRGSAVEQFRSLRSRMYEFRDLGTLKSILVSSGIPGEGKSFVAANLAISFTRHKASRVLLIDGDMRRSSLHKLFGCPSSPGLSDYLAGTATLAEVLQRARPDAEGNLPEGLESLTLMGGGKESDKAADLSGNRRFDELIATVAPLFDWIIVDSSPVNLVTDGVNLARACDGVLLVARGGVTRFEVARRALTELKASKILGFVLNAVDSAPKKNGYYGYDGYDSLND